MRLRLLTCVIGMLVLLSGCTGSPEPDVEPAKAPTSAPVSPVSSAEAEPESSPAASEFAITETGFGSNGPYVWVVAMVENRSPEVGQALTVSFNLLGSDDEILASDSQLDAVTVKGATMIVATQLEVPDGTSLKGASLETELFVEDNGAFTKSPFPAMKVGKVGIVKKYGVWEAAFTITNESTESVKEPQVRVACRNSDGKIIGGGVDFSAVVAPKGRFRVSMQLTVSGKPSSCDVAVSAPPLWDGPADEPDSEPSSQAHADAAAAFKLWVEQFNDRDWKAQYATLVPEQRAIVSETQFMACRDAGSHTFVWKGIVSAEDKPKSTIPGSNVIRAAVLLKVQLVSDGAPMPVTIHMFSSPQGWQWSLTGDAVVDCSSGG